MTRISRVFLTLALALASTASLAAPLAAQSHPDFSGKWVLDPKGSQGDMLPSSATVVVAQDAKTVKVDNTATSQMGEQKSSMTFSLDGSPSKNSISGPAGSLELTSTAKWDGAVLVVNTKGDAGGQSFEFSERWSLGADGKTMTLQRDISMAGQTMTLKLAFTKQ